jgi:long-chain acyl-CoA synthetase
MGLHDFTFYNLIQRNAVTFADRIAWHEVDDERDVTYRQYRQMVDRLAQGLQRAGIGKGHRLGVLGKNSLEYFLLYGAAAAVGAILLPVNWRLSAEEITFNLNDGEPAALFVDSEYQDLIEQHRPQMPSVRKCFNLKADQGRFLQFASLSADEKTPAPQPTAVGSDDGFVIIHTAAVGGRPRGALLSHANVLLSSMHLMRLFETTPQDVHLNLLPLFHIAAIVMVANTFHAGGLNVNMSKFDAARAVELIARRNASLMFDFSPILASLLEEAEKSRTDIRSLRAVLGLDTPDTIEKYQKATGGTFFCMYGQTETSCLATLGRYADRPGSAGKTIELADVRLVDDQDRPAATGEIGEIVMKGPMVFKGYWNLDEDNARTFRGGWHHTGDLGRFDADGFLWYEGRKADKELIKPGGENVYPAEVEKVVRQHPAVAETVVFGVPDPKWKEGIKAVCELQPEATLTSDELIRFVGERIASYKKPQYVEFVGELPRLEDGTPDRSAVKDRFGGPQQ